uniref:Uncharacterized protein n=1 Tax=Siphoviridae sp. ctYh54 TaxID=2826379 RepID=A0A8S5ME87_9CAUD|nr:MAG TPA: hypothetical protein [Siphoviridae sp. ctYh54]
MAILTKWTVKAKILESVRNENTGFQRRSF